MRRQDLVDREEKSSDAGEDRGGEKDHRPTVDGLRAQQARHHDEPGDDSDQAQHNVKRGKRRCRHSQNHDLPPPCVDRSVPSDRSRQPFMNASRSSLTRSFRVVHMPCVAPWETLRVPFLMIFEESSAESPIGTIWSSSPWSTRVGTSIFLRSSVRSVSEKALMQK